jgi:hypothetical protein
MNNKNKWLLVTLSFGSAGSLFWMAHHRYCHLNTKLDTTTTTPIVWSKEISPATLEHSWATWRDFYNTVKSVSREEFNKAIKQGKYKLLSIEEFLDLHVENHRLNEYKNAKTAEEFYPLENRPRGNTDINSVNYHLSLQSPISPICVAKVMVNETVRYIKLDGVHRLIAASIRKSPIKVLFIDL